MIAAITSVHGSNATTKPSPATVLEEYRTVDPAGSAVPFTAIVTP